MLASFNNLSSVAKTAKSKTTSRIERSVLKECYLCGIKVKRLDVHAAKYHAARNTPGKFNTKVNLTLIFFYFINNSNFSIFNLISEYRKILARSKVLLDEEPTVTTNTESGSGPDMYKVLADSYFNFTIKRFTVEEDTLRRETKLIMRIIKYSNAETVHLDNSSIRRAVLNLKDYLDTLHITASYKRKHCDAIKRLLFYMTHCKDIFTLDNNKVIPDLELSLRTTRGKYHSFELF